MKYSYHSAGKGTEMYAKNGLSYLWSARIFLISFLIVSVVCVSSYIIFSTNVMIKINYQTQLIKSLDETIKLDRSEDLKTILLWNPFFNSTDFDFGIGNEPFMKKCPVKECYITNDRNYQAVEDYDAIVFHTPTFLPKSKDEFPERRPLHQLYMMYNTESPSTHPPQPYVDDFINITATYRQDSDIFYPYFHIVDKSGNFMAPSSHPTWLTPELNEDDEETLMSAYRNKTKTVAWFVSNCNPSNNRMKYVEELKKYINVDIYGACGNTTCDKQHEKECKQMLKKDYYFYLSFENSNCLEYVSEKLANAYNSDLIPIVMNGADMNQIGMPHSYLDVRDFESPKKLAQELLRLISTPEDYISYFWWKRHYSVLQDISHVPFCELCSILHQNRPYAKRHVNLRRWMTGSAANPMCKNDIHI